MIELSRRNRIIFEVMLIVVSIGMAGLFMKMGKYGMVALNLFFLPVILSGYYLGRTAAGVLALFSALAVTIVSTTTAYRFAAFESPAMVGLALTIWAATMGMMALLMGTLCDERAKSVSDLQKAYVGVVEVLSKYLQSANPHTKARSTRVAELSQQVALELKVPRTQIDDIRVAALLHDLESVEITTQVMSRAVDVLESSDAARRFTFAGTDLVQSLGTVLNGALPLLVGQNEALRDCLIAGDEAPATPLGAQIISTVRAFDDLVSGRSNYSCMTPEQAIAELRQETGMHREDVLAALSRIAIRGRAPAEPALV